MHLYECAHLLCATDNSDIDSKSAWQVNKDSRLNLIGHIVEKYVMYSGSHNVSAICIIIR